MTFNNPFFWGLVAMGGVVAAIALVLSGFWLALPLAAPAAGLLRLFPPIPAALTIELVLP